MGCFGCSFTSADVSCDSSSSRLSTKSTRTSASKSIGTQSTLPKFDPRDSGTAAMYFELRTRLENHSALFQRLGKLTAPAI